MGHDTSEHYKTSSESHYFQEQETPLTFLKQRDTELDKLIRQRNMSQKKEPLTKRYKTKQKMKNSRTKIKNTLNGITNRLEEAE